MPAKGDTIHCLERKFEIATIELSSRGVIERASLAALANAMGVAPSTLTEAAGLGRASKHLVRKFALLCGFQSDDARWVDTAVPDSKRRVHPDPGYPGRDTPEGFNELLLEAFQGDRARLDAHAFDFHDDDLFEFELDDGGQETQLDVPFRLFLRLSTALGRPSPKVSFGFRRLRIKVIPELGERGRFIKHLGLESYVIRDAILTSSGGSKRPTWSLEAKNGVLLGEYATDEEPLCQLSDLGRLDTLRVEVSVNVHDPDYLFVQTPDDIAADTRAVVDALLRKSISGASNSEIGWKVLGVHKLRVRIENASHSL